MRMRRVGERLGAHRELGDEKDAAGDMTSGMERDEWSSAGQSRRSAWYLGQSLWGDLGGKDSHVLNSDAVSRRAHEADVEVQWMRCQESRGVWSENVSEVVGGERREAGAR